MSRASLLPISLCVVTPAALAAGSHFEPVPAGQPDATLAELQRCPHMAAITRYNLGIALIRTGKNEEGIGELDAIGRMDARSERLDAALQPQSVSAPTGAVDRAWLERQWQLPADGDRANLATGNRFCTLLADCAHLRACALTVTRDRLRYVGAYPTQAGLLGQAQRSNLSSAPAVAGRSTQ